MADKVTLNAQAIENDVPVLVNALNMSFTDGMQEICNALRALGDNNPIIEEVIKNGQAVEAVYNNTLLPDMRTYVTNLEGVADVSRFFQATEGLVTGVNASADASFKVDKFDAEAVKRPVV